MKFKSYYLITTTEGCATNLVENSTYSNYMQSNGMERKSSPEDAEVIVVNTCAYTTSQENRSVDIVKEYQEKYPDKEIIIGGCLTKIAPKKIDDLNVRASFNPGDVAELGKNLDLNAPDESDQKMVNFFDSTDFNDLTLQHKFLLALRPLFFKFEELIGKRFQPLHNIVDSAIVNEEYFAVTVSRGCAGKCTFCSIKMAKGHVKSRPVEIIIHEIKQGLEQGKRKIWLLGDDIGCYGIDRGEDFPKLLKSILEIDKEFELIINYFEPYFFLKYFEEMKPMLSDSRVINLNLPIQSADKEIVYQMGREYDPKIVLKKLKELKIASPALVVKTNIIVGFPGETLSAFFESVKSVKYFDAILALKFTARPKTRAYNYENQLSELSKVTRTFIINGFILKRHIFVALRSLFR